MSIGLASNRSCDESGPQRAQRYTFRWPNAMNGYTSSPLFIRKADRPAGSCCPRSALRSSHSPWPRLLKAGGSRTKQTDCLSARSCWVAPQCSPQTTRGAASGLLATLFSRGAARLSRLWPLSNEPLANRVFTSLDELEEVQAERCRWRRSAPGGVPGSYLLPLVACLTG